MTAKIIPFPTQQREREQGEHLLTPLDPIQTDRGIVWTVRLEIAPCGQPRGKPNPPSA